MGSRERRYIPWLVAAVAGILTALDVHVMTLLRTAPLPNEFGLMLALVLGTVIIGFRVQSPMYDLKRLLTGWMDKANYWRTTAKKAPRWMWAACALAFVYAGFWTVPDILGARHGASPAEELQFYRAFTSVGIYLFVVEATILYSLMVAERPEGSVSAD